MNCSLGLELASNVGELVWISHNAKFELLYLKLQFEISPPTVFCTRIANALITNGLLHHAKEEETAEIKPPQSKRKKKDSLNSYGKALADRLGVALPKDPVGVGRTPPAHLPSSRPRQ